MNQMVDLYVCINMAKIGRGCGEWEARVIEEKVILLLETCTVGLCTS